MTTSLLRFFFWSSSSRVSTAPFTEVSAGLSAAAGIAVVGAARRAEDGITVVGISVGEEKAAITGCPFRARRMSSRNSRASW